MVGSLETAEGLLGHLKGLKKRPVRRVCWHWRCHFALFQHGEKLRGWVFFPKKLYLAVGQEERSRIGAGEGYRHQADPKMVHY